MATAIGVGFLGALVVYQAILVCLIIAGKVPGEPAAVKTPVIPSLKDHGFEFLYDEGACDQSAGWQIIGLIRPEVLLTVEALTPKEEVVK